MFGLEKFLMDFPAPPQRPLPLSTTVRKSFFSRSTICPGKKSEKANFTRSGTRFGFGARFGGNGGSENLQARQLGKRVIDFQRRLVRDQLLRRFYGDHRADSSS